jgi:hypothetical protein
MVKFTKVTQLNGDLAWVNLDHVAYIIPKSYGSLIIFSGKNFKDLEAKETPEFITKLHS